MAALLLQVKRAWLKSIVGIAPLVSFVLTTKKSCSGSVSTLTSLTIDDSNRLQATIEENVTMVVGVA